MNISPNIINCMKSYCPKYSNKKAQFENKSMKFVYTNK